MRTYLDCFYLSRLACFPFVSSCFPLGVGKILSGFTQEALFLSVPGVDNIYVANSVASKIPG